MWSMQKENDDMAEVMAWTKKFIEEHRNLLERMHGYTSEMHRHDQLAKQLREMHRKNRSTHEGAR